MVISPPTIANIIFWQWCNQTYNAAFNYANRNTSNDNSTADIAQAYFSACAVSVSLGVGLNQLVKKLTKLPPTVRTVLGIAVPFTAVAAGKYYYRIQLQLQ